MGADPDAVREPRSRHRLPLGAGHHRLRRGRRRHGGRLLDARPALRQRAACAASSSSTPTTAGVTSSTTATATGATPARCYAVRRLRLRRRSTGRPTRPGSPSSVRTARSGAFLLAGARQRRSAPVRRGVVQLQRHADGRGQRSRRHRSSGSLAAATARWPAAPSRCRRPSRCVRSRPAASGFSSRPGGLPLPVDCSTVSRSPVRRTPTLPAHARHGRQRAGGRRDGVRTRLQPGLADLRRRRPSPRRPGTPRAPAASPRSSARPASAARSPRSAWTG